MGEPIYKDEAYNIVSALVSAGVPPDDLREMIQPQGRWRLLQAAALLNITQLPTIGNDQLIGIANDLVCRMGYEVILSFTSGDDHTSCTLAVRQGALMTCLFRFCWARQPREQVVERLWNELLRLPDVTCPWNNRELVISRKASA